MRADLKQIGFIGFVNLSLLAIIVGFSVSYIQDMQQIFTLASSCCLGGLENNPMVLDMGRASYI